MEKLCRECGAPFSPPGAAQRCDRCRTLVCGHCGKEFMSDRRRTQFCSLACVAAGKNPGLDKLKANPGKKPRTYHLRRRDRYGSQKDRDWRTQVFQRDDYTCQECGQRGGRLQAHHIKPYREHPELRHDLANGLTLCVECHKKTDSYGWSKYWHKKIAARRLSQLVLPLGAA